MRSVYRMVCPWTQTRPNPSWWVPARDNEPRVQRAHLTFRPSASSQRPVFEPGSIDRTLSFDVHIDNVYKSSCFHMRAIRHIRNHISEDTAKSIACSMIHELQLSHVRHVGCESEQASTCSKLRRAKRNKNCRSSDHASSRTNAPCLTWQLSRVLAKTLERLHYTECDLGPVGLV